MRKSIRLITTMACLFPLAIAASRCAKEPASKDEGPVLIGAVLPLTGDAGTFGLNAMRGAQLAIEEANKEGGINGRLIELRSEDSRGTAENAVSATRKLLDVDKVRMLLGDVTSAGTHAMIPVVTQAKVPLISPSASDPALSGASPYFSRVWPSDVYEAEVIGGYAIRNDLKKIDLMYANTDYGVAMIREFRKVAKGRTNLDIPVTRETLDYRPVLQRLKASGADGLFIVLYPEDAKRFLQQFSEQGLDLPLLATATIEDPEVARQPQADRLVFASPVPPDEAEPRRQIFVKNYTRRFQGPPGVLSDAGYDAALLFIQAAREEGLDPDKISSHIRSVRNFKGVSGVLSFSATGDVQKPYRLRTVRAGAFTWLDQ